MGVCGSKPDVPAQQPRREQQTHQPRPQPIAAPPSNIPPSLRALYEQVCPTHDDHKLFEIEVTPLLQIKNPNNLNNRYTYMYKVDESNFVGKDIKKTHAYISRIPLTEIKKRREEFWGRLG